MTQTFECAVCAHQSETRTCDGCRNRIGGMLGQIPELFTYLVMTSRRRDQTGSGDGRSSRAIHAAIPGNLDALSLIGPAAAGPVMHGEDQAGPTPVLELLLSWCDVIAEGRGLKPVRRHVTAVTVRLTAHLPWIVEQEWVVDFEAEVRELLRTIRGVTRTEPRRVPLLVMCPRCEMRSMIREDHSGWAAECVNCPAMKLDQRDYNLLIKGQVTQQTADDGVKS
jgi:hypothetical protein